MRNTLTTFIVLLATCLAAFAQYGGIDASFGSQGIIRRNIASKPSSNVERGVAGALQPDGKLVAVATVSPLPAVVMRFNPDGAMSPCSSDFGSGATRVIPRTTK